MTILTKTRKEGPNTPDARRAVVNAFVNAVLSLVRTEVAESAATPLDVHSDIFTK
jgi:hypothetical protein